MKIFLMLFFLCLGYYSSYAQDNIINYPADSEPITTAGISLPQLITTDINRSELQFGINFSEGFKQPNLSVNVEKFISDKNKQFTIRAGARIDHSLSFLENDNPDFYTLNDMSLNLGADIKLFNQKNYFFQFETQNIIGKQGNLSEFDFLRTNNSITLGFGKGRIDFVNDGAATIAIIKKLTKYGILERDLSEEEYSLLTEKIRELKNRRKFVNRSYPLTETEEIQDLLMNWGLLNKDVNVTAIISDAYKYEPMLNRTTGSQLRFATTGSYSYTNAFSNLTSKGISASLSYMIHSPINLKWQYNKGITAYSTTNGSSLSDPRFADSKFERSGINIKNDIHYLVDTRMRISFLTTVGYDFTNKFYQVDPFYDPISNNEGFYLDARTEFEYQISRTISTTFGIQLNLSSEYTFTGLNAGLKF